MKTSIIEVGGLLSVLSAHGVEKRLTRLPGVVKAEVNCVSGSTTVEYDDAVTSLSEIKARLDECGHHCHGELVPRHICIPEDPPAAVATGLIAGKPAQQPGWQRSADTRTISTRRKRRPTRHMTKWPTTWDTAPAWT